MKPEDIGSYLKQLRLEHNLTQKELASKLHITHQAVSNWEKGKALPDITILSQLGDVYGVSIDNLLLKTQPEDPTQKQPNMIARRIFAFFGLLLSLTGIALFLFYDRHFITPTLFVAFMLIVSILFSYTLRIRIWYYEYLVITSVLIIVSLITVPKNINYYLLDTTEYLQIVDQVDMVYPREFDELTQVETYNYIFDQYALIYTEGEEDIDIFNLSKYSEEPYQTIETNIKIYDLEIYNEDIYITTFDEEIPGEFKLYQLDFETQEFTVIYESQEVLRLYLAYEQLYLVSDPMYESSTKIYHYDPINDIMLGPDTVDFEIYGMDYYSYVSNNDGVEYHSNFIMSVTNLEAGDPSNKIALFDYNYELKQVLYEAEDGEIHYLFSDYGYTMIGTDEAAILFQGEDYILLESDYGRWPEPISPEYIRVGESLYRKNWDTEEIEQYSDILFYDEDYHPQGAIFLISDEQGNLYAIDNELYAAVHPVPREIDDVYITSSYRITFYVLGIITFGYFITLGHQPKHSKKQP